MVCFIIGMSLMSSTCVGIYMCIISHGCRGWFLIVIICKYGEISAGVGILVMFPGYAYSLFMSVSSPPLVGVYCLLCCMQLVSVCVLLNINLWSGNKFCMYLVDLVAVTLVSCIVIMAGFCVVIRCRFGRAVFSDAAFQVIICVFRLVVLVVCICGGGLLWSCGGCEYSFIGSLCFSVSLSSFSGKNGNLFVSVSKFIF